MSNAFILRRVGQFIQGEPLLRVIPAGDAVPNAGDAVVIGKPGNVVASQAVVVGKTGNTV
jgi:hypothetical protein